MKIYDCFTFFNEFELLDLRLELLDEWVDRFVLVEADSTHTGKPKGFWFEENKERYSRYLDKIIHIKVDDMPRSDDPWVPENFQRNCIARGLQGCMPNDLVIISDLDELPSPGALLALHEARSKVKFCYHRTFKHNVREAVQHPECLVRNRFGLDLLERTPLAMQQQLFRYFLNCRCRSLWQGSVIAKAKHVVSPQWIRDRRNRFPRVAEGGWHFSFLGGVERVLAKINAIAETWHSTDKTNSCEYLKQMMESGRDFLERDGDFNTMSFIDIQGYFPPALDAAIRKYPALVFSKDTYPAG